MTYTDTFLVEKLREILLRLYPTPQTSPLQSQPAPRRNLSLLSLLTMSSELQSSDNKTNQYFYNGSDLNLSLNENDFGIGVIHNYSTTDRRFPADESYIVGNYTLQSPPEFTTVTATRNSDHYDTTALTRNLHEFIQVLKMSLSPNNIGGSVESSHDLHTDNGGGDRAQEEIRYYDNSGQAMDNSDDLELNLTLEDILDLNNLLDGSESSLQFKHFLIIFLYFLIACVSIVGNLLVVQLVIRSRRLHTLTHALLANLAVADLFMASFNMPFSAARVILAEWPFGSALCHLVPFVQVTSVYVTSITMAVIALDRYSVIMNPLGTRMKSSQGVLLVFGIWLLSGLLSLPYAIHHKVVRVLTVGVVERCQAEFGSIGSRRWLTVGTFLAQYLIPLIFTTVSYVSIMQRLRHRSSELGSTTPRQMAAQSRAKKKTIKMLVLTVLFFAISWAPINIYHLLTHFSVVRHNSTAILVCHLIAMSSCTVNPFIYCWFNEHFRREALKWMRCFRTRRCPIVHPGVEINGMLTRADTVCHRTQSTTFVHSASLRRSPLPQPTHSQTQSLYVQQSYRGNSARSPCPRYVPSSRRFDCLEGPVGYRPESLFLARRSSDDIFADSQDRRVGIVRTTEFRTPPDDHDDRMCEPEEYLEVELNLDF